MGDRERRAKHFLVGRRLWWGLFKGRPSSQSGNSQRCWCSGLVSKTNYFLEEEKNVCSFFFFAFGGVFVLFGGVFVLFGRFFTFRA